MQRNEAKRTMLPTLVLTNRFQGSGSTFSAPRSSPACCLLFYTAGSEWQPISINKNRNQYIDSVYGCIISYNHIARDTALSQRSSAWPLRTSPVMEMDMGLKPDAEARVRKEPSSRSV